MGEKLLSERDAYELADILNAKGITEFARRAENIARNQTIEEAIVEVDDGEWQDCVELRMKVEALRKPEGGG